MTPTATPNLTNRARKVLAHLLTEPYADHIASFVARATGYSTGQVNSVFTLLEQCGWAERHSGGGLARPLVLTAAGREHGPAAVAHGPATPLSVLDAEDPALADRVRDMTGLPRRHS